MGFGAIVKQQLGEAFVAAIGDGAARSSPKEQARPCPYALIRPLTLPNLPRPLAIALGTKSAAHVAASQNALCLAGCRF